MEISVCRIECGCCLNCLNNSTYVPVHTYETWPQTQMEVPLSEPGETKKKNLTSSDRLFGKETKSPSIGQLRKEKKKKKPSQGRDAPEEGRGLGCIWWVCFLACAGGRCLIWSWIECKRSVPEEQWPQRIVSCVQTTPCFRWLDKTTSVNIWITNNDKLSKKSLKFQCCCPPLLFVFLMKLLIAQKWTEEQQTILLKQCHPCRPPNISLPHVDSGALLITEREN